MRLFELADAVEIDLVDGEFVVENGQIGDEAFFDLAEILDAEVAGLVVGRGLDKLA